MKMEIRETDADCCVSTRPSKIDPLSVIKQDEIREWRRRYSLPDDVTIHARVALMIELLILELMKSLFTGTSSNQNLGIGFPR